MAGLAAPPASLVPRRQEPSHMRGQALPCEPWCQRPDGDSRNLAASSPVGRPLHLRYATPRHHLNHVTTNPLQRVTESILSALCYFFYQQQLTKSTVILLKRFLMLKGTLVQESRPDENGNRDGRAPLDAQGRRTSTNTASALAGEGSSLPGWGGLGLGFPSAPPQASCRPALGTGECLLSGWVRLAKGSLSVLTLHQ